MTKNHSKTQLLREVPEELSRAEIKEKVAKIKAKADSRIPVEDKREPITLNPNGAVVSILQMASQSDQIRVALAAFCEGRELKGQWSLRVTGAELVPAK